MGAFSLKYMHFGKTEHLGESGTERQRTLEQERKFILRLEARQDQIRSYYSTLFRMWGAQHWWPAHTRFEVIVGAYLTQNTAWTNVEKALANLRRARLLSVTGI